MLQCCRRRLIHCLAMEAQRLQGARAEVSQHAAAQVPSAILICQLLHAGPLCAGAGADRLPPVGEDQVLHKAADAMQQRALGSKPLLRLAGSGCGGERSGRQVQAAPQLGLGVEDAVPAAADQCDGVQKGGFQALAGLNKLHNASIIRAPVEYRSSVQRTTYAVLAQAPSF